MTRMLVANALAASALALASTAAVADRAPTAVERADIGAALSAQGYASWGGVKWDDGRWEIDNALGPDGKRYDLKLDDSLTVRESELED
jgi:opacity protein-like surface antigen